MPCTKINSKWVNNLRVRAKTIKQENIGVNLHNLGFGNKFLDMTPKSWVVKNRLIGLHWN